MTGLLLPLASLTGYLLFLSRFTSWPNAFLPFFTISSLMCLLYAAAVAGQLLPGAYFLAGLGLAAGLAGAYFSGESLRKYSGRLLQPGTAVFFLLAAFLWAACFGFQYFAWDEFSHWGLTIKEIFARNALLGADSVLACKDYPPATALFQYYLVVFTGWSEGVTCFSQALVALSAAAALLTGLRWSQWLKAAVLVVFLNFLMERFGFNLRSLYVDHVLGLFFGGLLAAYFLGGDYRPRALLKLLPALFILPLIKSAGVLLALMAAAIITADQFCRFRAARPQPRKGRGRLLAGLCALLLLAPLLSAKTWSLRVKTLNLPQTLSTKAGLPELKRTFSAAATERDKQTLANFGKAFLSTRAEKALPPLHMLLLLACLGLALAWKRKEPGESCVLLSATFITLAGFALYTAGLVFLYLYSFGSYEGLGLASFGRYMSIFFMAWSLFLAVFILRGPASGDSRLLPYWAKAVILLAGAWWLANKGGFPQPPAGNNELRRQASEKAARALALMPAGAKVYLIWQNDNGYGPQVLSYELAPHATSIRDGAWSLGKPYYPGDVWTADLTPAAWQEKLKGYDYVLLGNADKNFRDAYGGLFEDGAGGEYLYEVKVRKGKARLYQAGNRTPD